MSPDPLLRLRNWSLTRSTPEGDVFLLENIDLDVRPGQWLAVLGANGSGKSSLLKYLASDESPVAEQAAIMFQDPDEQIFASSVEREVALGRPVGSPAFAPADWGLEGLAGADPRLLSAGQKQRLVLAVAVGLEPGILLCDEPTALQDPAQSLWVLDRLQQWLASTGGALVTATCDRTEASRADWLVVLENGRILRQGRTADLIASQEVEALLGKTARPPLTESTAPDAVDRALLKLQGVGCRFGETGWGFSGVDLLVGPGDRIGINGPNGCGKSTLLASCAGARSPDSGMVELDGRVIYGAGGRDLAHGAAMLAPQFPEYLFTRATVADEIRLDPALAGREAGEFLGMLGLEEELANRNPHDLSTGQRRRLALGLVLQSRRPVLLLDEPTAALDREGRELILEQLRDVPPHTAVVIASHDTKFLQAAGCRLLTLGPRGLMGPGNNPT